MKEKLMRIIILCLVIASLVPYAAAAESGVNLWCENDSIDMNNIVINVGETISIGCDAYEWATRTAPDHNHTVISVVGSGGEIQMSGEKRSDTNIMVFVTGVADGTVTLTFTIQAGFSENPEKGRTKIDQVFSTTSVTVPITVIGERKREGKERPEVINLEVPTIDIINDADGSVCSESEVTQQVNDLTQFVVGLNNKHWTGITVMDSNENWIDVLAYNCQNADGFTGYVIPDVSNIRWSLHTGKDEYQLTQYGNMASVLCKKDSASGTLTALMVVEKVVDGFLTGEQVLVTQKVYLKGEAKKLVVGALLKEVDVDKVPNPFANLSASAWYYDSFMSLYAWGLLDGLDFSEKQDGSLILKMEKTVFDTTEENVSAVFLSESEWSAKQLSANGAAAVLSTLTGGSNGIRLLASTNLAAVAPAASQTDGRGSLVQKVYNMEKALKGSVGSYTTNPFTDVSARKPYYQAVLWGAYNQIINGYGGGRFGPDDGITREQFCAILYRYATNNGIALTATQTAKTFTDGSSISDWAKEAVAACQKAGIISGYPDNTFKPRSYVTFQEACAMVDRFCCK